MPWSSLKHGHDERTTIRTATGRLGGRSGTGAAFEPPFLLPAAPTTLSLLTVLGCEGRHCGDLSIGLGQYPSLSPLWIKAVLTFYRVLPMRAALVWGVGAALGLLALANLSTSARRSLAWTRPY